MTRSSRNLGSGQKTPTPPGINGSHPSAQQEKAGQVFDEEAEGEAEPDLELGLSTRTSVPKDDPRTEDRASLASSQGGNAEPSGRDFTGKV